MKPVRLIAFLMILASICTVLLSTANFAFEKASEVFNIRLYAVILELFQISAAEEEIAQVFEQNFEIRKIAGKDYYISKKVTPGIVVFKNAGPGLWSTIEILLAVQSDFESLYGLRVLAQAETPGLGGRISEIEFQERFRGVELRPELRIVKFASGANEVDSITGASKTGDALEKLINRSIEQLDSAFGREGG
jgi:Na+-transporting NADH:ubiquinone oxidoreductase subunit NqrC